MQKRKAAPDKTQLILMATLSFCVPMAVGFIGRGYLALTAETFIGYPDVGLAAAEGEHAKQTGYTLLLIGALFALLSILGLLYSLRRIRTDPKYNVKRKKFNWSLKSTSKDKRERPSGDSIDQTSTHPDQ